MSSSKFFRKMRSLAVVSAGAGIFFAGLNVYKGNEKFYDNFVMPIVQKIPPEASHRLAVLACKYNLFPESKASDPETLCTDFFGQKISNPIGIAAGFDKQGEAVEGLERIGFGIVEIGSITPFPQPGNEKPRVFRLVEDKAIINRYGFNSDGHKVVFDRLKEIRMKSSLKGVLGINLGKNKTSTDALRDYVEGVQLFGTISDYLVINVSSPNTPGLRDLQGKKDLENLLRGVLSARNKLPTNNKVPIFLKLAPDLTQQDIKDITSVISSKDCKVDGLIISNTTIDKTKLNSSEELTTQAGGLSGAPLKNRSTELIAQVYNLTGGKVPIIGVGGVFSGADAYEKIQAGASYVQLYTSLIYHGPPIVEKVKRELDEILKKDGFNNVKDAVGSNFKQFLRK
ncbi:DHODH family protein [Megaselia abdita]